MSEFVHLHVHSHYSILDGMSKIPDLIKRSTECGMNALALTDHGNMYGAKDFFDCSVNYNKKLLEGTQKIIKQNKDILSAIKKGDNSQGKSEEEVLEAIALAEKDLERKKERLFKPIFGVEAYCARRTLYNKDNNVKMINPESGKEQVVDLSGWHLILLAKNKTGYKNLCKIVSKSWIDGFYYRPRIDKNILEEFHEGIIVSSACLGGEIPQLIMKGDLEEAEKSVNWFKSVFGDDYYIEIQRHRTNKANANYEVYQRQEEVIPHLLELARKTNTKVIATNDVHFVEESHADAHERLICLSTNKKINDPSRMLYTKQEWLKSPDEMASIFSDMPEVLSNTIEIVNKIEAYSIDSAPIMPVFDIPEDFATEAEYHQKFSEQDLFEEFTRNEKGEIVLSKADAEAKVKVLGGYERLYRIKLEADYLAKLTWSGAEYRYGKDLSDELRERIEFELHVMKTMGFPGYFLIVHDYIRAAREELHVAVGPGRGSAAGSVVAYCLKITDLDPLKYGLLFERFLNPDRISLPDIDVDFDDDHRESVLNWVRKKYGKDRVAQIITFGTMATKSAIKDVARVQDVPLPEVNKITSLIPDKFPEDSSTHKSPAVSIANCLKLIPEFIEIHNSSNENITSMIDYANDLEDTIRQTGVHACGVIIGADNLINFAPLSIGKDKRGNDVLITQFDGKFVESVGLIKMDFLGLKTLSIIRDAIALIKETKGIDIDIDKIPIDDPKTYDLYCMGQTIATFQFESPGMQKYLRALQPRVFEDLIAMNALYRPGPMEYIPQFINRKMGKEPVVYDIPCMEEYLKETYGITVYQEQVMLLSRQLANFTRGESDALRKAMGKKKIDVLEKMQAKFIEGGLKNGHNKDVLNKIWEDWKKFASYAFNKSHAACYSWVAYQTGWLKAHYPSEYMAAVLSGSLNDIGELTKLLSECKNMGINVHGPDVNFSKSNFTVEENGDICFGLSAIKGMGENAAQNIVETRKDGKFTDVFDFAKRVNIMAVNRKGFEVLVLSGAFDGITSNSRKSFFEVDAKNLSFIEKLMRYGSSEQVLANNSQMSLFGGDQAASLPKPIFPNIEEWSTLDKLEREKEVIGIYLSSHPLDDYQLEIESFCNVTLMDLKGLEPFNNKDVIFAGMVVDCKEGLTKNNKNYGRITLEDYSEKFDLMLFGKDYTTFRNFEIKGALLLVEGHVQQRQYNPQELELKIKTIQMLSEAKNKVKSITIDMPLNSINSIFIDDFVRMLDNNKGKIPLRIRVVDDETNVSVDLFSRKYQIDFTHNLGDMLKLNELHYKVSYN